MPDLRWKVMLTYYESSRRFLGLWSLSSLLMLFLIAFCGLEKTVHMGMSYKLLV